MVLALGGAAGKNARYWLGRWVGESMGQRLPFGNLHHQRDRLVHLGMAAVLILERLPPCIRIGTCWSARVSAADTPPSRLSSGDFSVVRNGSHGWPLRTLPGA